MEVPAINGVICAERSSREGIGRSVVMSCMKSGVICVMRESCLGSGVGSTGLDNIAN